MIFRQALEHILVQVQSKLLDHRVVLTMYVEALSPKPSQAHGSLPSAEVP